jgi:hypothetical protein
MHRIKHNGIQVLHQLKKMAGLQWIKRTKPLKRTILKQTSEDWKINMNFEGKKWIIGIIIIIIKIQNLLLLLLFLYKTKVAQLSFRIYVYTNILSIMFTLQNSTCQMAQVDYIIVSFSYCCEKIKSANIKSKLSNVSF